jgi:hypothetical protein
MSKSIIFDMDGTIADLYGVKDWLPKLRSENPSPYAEALPLYDMTALSAILDVFKNIGYKIIVVSWGSMGATAQYTREVKKVKKAWLEQYGFPFDEFHVVKYGTPKSKFISDNEVILVDDSTDVINEFIKTTRATNKRVVNAKMNIINQLLEILQED